MKVLFLGAANDPSWPGGESNADRILISELSERGFDINAAYIHRLSFPGANFKLSNLPSVKPTQIIDSRVFNYYRRHIQKSQSDVIIVSYDHDLSCLWASVLSGIPTIAHAMSPWVVCPKGDLFISRQHCRCEGPNLNCGKCMFYSGDNSLAGLLCAPLVGQAPSLMFSAMEIRKMRLIRDKLNCASAIVTDSLFLKSKMIQLGYDSQKTRLIYYGVPQSNPEPSENEQKQKTVLFLSYSAGFQKGGPHFVEISKKLKPEFPEVRFLWVGQQQIQGDSFETKGYVWNNQELQDIYESSYLYLLPTLRPETLSFAALQAMAHGKPVVAYDAGANRETTIHNETGMLAEWGNIEQLTSYVRSLLLDERAAKRMGGNARKLIQSKFSVEQMANNHLELIEKITQRRD